MEQIIRYRSPDAPAERDLLLLEQEAWDAHIGLLTRAGLVRHLSAALYGTDGEAGIDCGFRDGNLVITILAWPLAPHVRFRLAASAGVLGPVVVGRAVEAQSVSFALERVASLRRPADTIEGIRWLTGPYDEAGEVVPAPEAGVSGRELRLSRPVFGSAWIRATGTRHAATLTIPQAEAEPLLAAGWNEYVVGLPDGGRPVALALSAPPGAEELAREGATCGRSSYRFRAGRDPLPPPTASPADKHVSCDYCRIRCEEEP